MGAAKTALDTARGKVLVTPGVIDDDAEYAYTNGQCIALSLALAEATGWPIVAHLARPGNPDWERRTHGRQIARESATDGWFYSFVHTLVRTPHDLLLDIRSGHDPEDYCIEGSYRYGTTALVDCDVDTLRAALADALRHGAVKMKQDAKCAAAFATELLRDYHSRYGA